MKKVTFETDTVELAIILATVILHRDALQEKLKSSSEVPEKLNKGLKRIRTIENAIAECDVIYNKVLKAITKAEVIDGLAKELADLE